MATTLGLVGGRRRTAARHIAADGETLTARPRQLGTTDQGIACSHGAGTSRSGRSPIWREIGRNSASSISAPARWITRSAAATLAASFVVLASRWSAKGRS